MGKLATRLYELEPFISFFGDSKVGTSELAFVPRHASYEQSIQVRTEIE